MILGLVTLADFSNRLENWWDDAHYKQVIIWNGHAQPMFAFSDLDRSKLLSFSERLVVNCCSLVPVVFNHGILITLSCAIEPTHDDVIKCKHFPCYWSFVWGIRRSPVNSPQKGQWRWALMFSLICAWTKVWVNTRDAGDLRHHCTDYDVTVMFVENV